MIKKLLLAVTALMLYGIPLQAQHLNFELSYQSFRPFIHFQLDYETGYYHDDYESAYLKGYMDGVNDRYYYNHRYHDLVRDARIYEVGYRDGFRDRALLIRLRGHHWYKRHRFAYTDYYNPSYSVRIWLDGLSIAFLQAPAHRLPRRWKHRAHPHVRKYRHWIAKNRHNKHYRGYKRAITMGKKHHNRGKLYERQAVKASHRYRNKSVHKGSRNNGNRKFRQNRGPNFNKGRGIERAKERRRHVFDKQKQQRKQKIKRAKRTTRNRGSVKRGRSAKKEKKGRGRKRGKRNKDN